MSVTGKHSLEFTSPYQSLLFGSLADTLHSTLQTLLPSNTMAIEDAFFFFFPRPQQKNGRVAESHS